MAGEFGGVKLRGSGVFGGRSAEKRCETLRCPPYPGFSGEWKLMADRRGYGHGILRCVHEFPPLWMKVLYLTSCELQSENFEIVTVYRPPLFKSEILKSQLPEVPPPHSSTLHPTPEITRTAEPTRHSHPPSSKSPHTKYPCPKRNYT